MADLNHEHPEPAPRHAAPSLCLLLAGGPKPAPLTVSTGHSVLDLSLTSTETVLDRWMQSLLTLPHEHAPLGVQLITDSKVPEATLESDVPGLELTQRSERARLRGPIGVAKDECADLDPDAIVLLAEAGRVAAARLDRMFEAHLQRQSAVTVGVNPDRSPAGIYLIRRHALEFAPARGFMDLKEQWLPKVIEAGHDVHVFELPFPGALPLRTADLFFKAVRLLNELPDPLESALDPIQDDESRDQKRRSVIAACATVATDAVIVDSVIMRHATVGAGAVVARSLVCPRGVVTPDQRVVDAVLGPTAVDFSGLVSTARSTVGP